ncbi:MAG: alpha-E domain-containing protein [Pseudomonadota bacterium]
MLSRTADHLFWMARYIERAENTARMLDVTHQMSLLPQSDAQAESHWAALLGITELRSLFEQHYSVLSAANVLEFMVWDLGNPSSIYNCLRVARENAHAVRGRLTTEVWEMHNATWLELQQLARSHRAQQDADADISPFFDWVKFRSHLSRGVTIGTMLKDEAFYFIRLGTFFERADNTARILDAQYHALAQQGQHTQKAALPNGVERRVNPDRSLDSNPHRDFYHWNALLRSVSAFEIYRRVYRDVIIPERIVELLILRADMPRSLLACLQEVVSNLASVQNHHSAETQRRAGLLQSELQFGRVNDILETGLHAYLTRFLERIHDLGIRISQDFLLPQQDV